MTLLFFEWPQFCRQAHCNSFAEAGGLWAVCIMLVEDEAGLRERVLNGKPLENGQPNTAHLPAGNDSYIANWKTSIEIVDLHIINGDVP